MTTPQTTVLVVDDSAVIRGMITKILEEDATIKVIGTAGNGEIAIKSYAQLKPDVMVLDIEMPVMDGITALKQIIKSDPQARVLMCSTLTLENAQISLEAMAIGAIDYIPKPTSTSEIGNGEDFKKRIRELVTAIAKPKGQKFAPLITPKPITAATQIPQSKVVNTTNDLSAVSKLAAIVPRVSDSIHITPDFKTRSEPSANWKPRILAIGSSTGGPQALFNFLKALKAKSPVANTPIVLTQHMPATFTALLAQHLTQQTGIPFAEASEGAAVKPGHGLVAKGGLHMLAKKDGNDVTVTLNDGPQENYCKPAVDPMLRSLIPIYGRDILVVILTGMGQDGAVGARLVTESGGFAAAQDQKSSVVWGMPGATASTNCCSFVGAPDALGAFVARYVS